MRSRIKSRTNFFQKYILWFYARCVNREFGQKFWKLHRHVLCARFSRNSRAFRHANITWMTIFKFSSTYHISAHNIISIYRYDIPGAKYRITAAVAEVAERVIAYVCRRARHETNIVPVRARYKWCIKYVTNAAGGRGRRGCNDAVVSSWSIATLVRLTPILYYNLLSVRMHVTLICTQ